MSQLTLPGTCLSCGKHFSRASMTRHLKTCGVLNPNALVSAAPARLKSKQCFHLFVEARDSKIYWLHLAVPADAYLDNLDTFLRRTWLECCGHLSAFTIAGERYATNPMREEGESGMGMRVGRILHPEMTFTHEYDYGSTTELKLKVMGLLDGKPRQGDVELLARNDAPSATCQLCASQPATQICGECAWNGNGWLCASCAKSHECGEEMCLPVVNSPRAGVCGYTG